MKRQKNISSFVLKQQFADMLSTELRGCRFDIVLGFESNFSERICALRVLYGKRLEIYINLNQVRKTTAVKGSSLLFKIRYCVLFVADYVRQIEKAKSDLPESYFEGLVFLNAIEVHQSAKKVSVYSPLSLRKGKPKRAYCVRPIEICSAVNALNRLRLSFLSELNETDRRVAEEFVDRYLLYAGLPEVAYVKARIPVYSLPESIKRLAGIVAKEPETVREFPILTLAPFEQMEQMMTKDLFLSCMQSDNRFMTGAGVRLFSFLQVPYEFEEEKIFHDKLVDIMKQYIDDSLMYYKELSGSGETILKDNLYAIKTAVKEINNYLSAYGYDIKSGNIHLI